MFKQSTTRLILASCLIFLVILTSGCGVMNRFFNLGGQDNHSPVSGDSGNTDNGNTGEDGDNGNNDGNNNGTPNQSGTASLWSTPFYAPYVDATAYPVVRLSDIARDHNQKLFTLGFIVAESPTTCSPSWGTYYPLATGPSAWGPEGEYFLYDEINTLRTTYGGDVMVSLGGASNTPLAKACTSVDELVARYKAIIDQLDLTYIDFDIEGTWVADHGPAGSVERRSEAIARLQQDFAAEGRPLVVWYTLPVLPTGLTADGMEVVRSALRHGVELAGVNVMTMDYGDSAAPNPQNNMAEYGIQAITALHQNLKSLYQEFSIPKTDAELWAMVGTTPMIGLNDVITELFNLEDAQQTVDFAREKGIGMLGNWSVNRDQACPTTNYVSISCSSSPDQTQSYEFLTIFQSVAL